MANTQNNAPEGTGSRPAERKQESAKKKRPSLVRRAKHFLHVYPWLVPAAVLITALVVGGMYFLRQDSKDQKGKLVSASNQVNVGSGYRDITYKGKRYRYNNRVTAILYAGVDSEGEMKPYKQYTFAPRADSISLIVMDELNHKMTVVALSRDTMTPINRYTLNGKLRGKFTDHLGYAFTYGDNGPVSCANLCAAVSDLLYGVPVNEYVISNRSSLPLLSEIIGPVEVTVPNDDLADYDLLEGDRVFIDSTNLELFVRSRDTEEDLSNVGRMERQQAYIDGAMGQLLSVLDTSPTGTWEKLEAAEGCIQTNITRSQYLKLVKALKNVQYGEGSYYIPAGNQVVGEMHDEFYPNEEELLAKVIELFYLPR